MLDTMPKEWPAPRMAESVRGAVKHLDDRYKSRTPPEICVFRLGNGDCFAMGSYDTGTYEIDNSKSIIALKSAQSSTKRRTNGASRIAVSNN